MDTKSRSAKPPKRGFCIFVNALMQGSVPVVRNREGFPYVYPTELEAQREIADDLMERLRQFLDGERDFDDAMTVEEYIVEVEVLPDGSVIDEHGFRFGNEDWYRGA